MKFVHTNIVSRNWQRLAAFYEKVFHCKPVPPVRDQSGVWLEKGTGVKGAALQGIHLRLPGYGLDGPTLEIYQYSSILSSDKNLPNRKGIGHIAFEVEDVEQTLVELTEFGGVAIGEISCSVIEGVGTITFVYAADPDGNIIEIQHWDKIS